MSRKPPRTPQLTLHKASGRGYVRIDGHCRYLGPFDDPATHEAYHRFIGEWIASGRTMRVSQDEVTIAELCAQYWEHAKTYYRKADGAPTGSLTELRIAMGPLRSLYGSTPARKFGPLALKAIRGTWLEAGLSRTSINKRVGYLKRVFKWAAENEIIRGEVWHALDSLSNLKAGRTEAPEPRFIAPVPELHIEKVRPHVSPQVWGMIELQLLTGARPGEIVGLRPIDIDTSGAVWTARLTDHKTAYSGRERTLYFGPKAQLVLKEFMTDRPLHLPIFSPRDAESHRHSRASSHRRPDQKSNPRSTDRTLGDMYTVNTYRRAIARACKRKEVNIPPWAPNRLRHNFATNIRKIHGLDAAQVLLGHASADITQVYAEVDRAKAMKILAEIG